MRGRPSEEAAAAAAHLQVGLAGHGAHRGGEVLHGGAVDEIDAVAERHAERDADDGQRRRPSARRRPATARGAACGLRYWFHEWALFWIMGFAIPALAGVAIPALAQEPPEWFAPSFLDIREDAAEAARDGKRLMIYFMQDGCPYCKQLVTVNFRDVGIAEKMQRSFMSVAINIGGDREVTAADGRKLPEKRFAAALKVQFTPTLVFFDERGGRAPHQRRPAPRGVPYRARSHPRRRHREVGERQRLRRWTCAERMGRS